MRIFCAGTILILAAATFAGESGRPTAAAIVSQIREARKATDLRASGRVVVVGAGGERKPHQVAMRAKSFGGEIRFFCEVTEPAAERVRLLLDISASGRASIRVARPKDRAAQEMVFDRWNEELLGSHLSFEDLMESHFLWSRQTLLKEEKYGARQCYVVRSEPGPADRSHYAAVTAWLDQEILYPVRVLKTVRATGASKEFIYYGLRQHKGLWSASQIEVKSPAKPGSTLLIINRGSAKAALSRADFDPALLVKPW